MIILILLIILNVWLLILFNLFDKYNVHTIQAIVINYATTLVVGTLMLGHFPITQSTLGEPFFPYAIILGFTFIAGFYILAQTVNVFGVALTSIAQKMTLILPVIFGIWWYGEQVNFLKWLGIGCALITIILINLPSKSDAKKFEKRKSQSLLLILTFVIGGIIDTLLYYVGNSQMGTTNDINFMITLFATACSAGILLLIYGYIFKNYKWNWNNLFAGILLGIPNFFTIYCLLILIDKGFKSNVLFPILNVSIIALAALVGSFIFKEKLNKVQWLGFASAILCILLIALSS